MQAIYHACATTSDLLWRRYFLSTTREILRELGNLHSSILWQVEQTRQRTLLLLDTVIATSLPLTFDRDHANIATL